MNADDYRGMGRNADGSIMLRVQVLRWLAKLMAVQFKIGGIPYGASYERAINHEPLRRSRQSDSAAAGWSTSNATLGQPASRDT